MKSSETLKTGLFFSGQVIKSLQGGREERTEMYTIREKTGREQIKHTLLLISIPKSF